MNIPQLPTPSLQAADRRFLAQASIIQHYIYPTLLLFTSIPVLLFIYALDRHPLTITPQWLMQSGLLLGNIVLLSLFFWREQRYLHIIGQLQLRLTQKQLQLVEDKLAKATAAASRTSRSF